MKFRSFKKKKHSQHLLWSLSRWCRCFKCSFHFRYIPVALLLWPNLMDSLSFILSPLTDMPHFQLVTLLGQAKGRAGLITEITQLFQTAVYHVFKFLGPSKHYWEFTEKHLWNNARTSNYTSVPWLVSVASPRFHCNNDCFYSELTSHVSSMPIATICISRLRNYSVQNSSKRPW